MINKKYKLPVLVSTHPGTKKAISQIKNKNNFKNIFFLKPFSFKEYISLQVNAKLVISDSGSITEESSIMNFPAINLRDVHERPEGMEEGVAIMTGLSEKRVLEAIPIAASMKTEGLRSIELVSDYYAPGVSDKVLKIILSYTDFVKRQVWKEYE